MKLVLQIAGGILLACVVVVGLLAAYRYLSAASRQRAESDATAKLRGVTIEEVKASCGAPLRDSEEQLLSGWRTLVFPAAAATLDPLGDSTYRVAWVKTSSGATAYDGLQQIQMLPCLASAKSAGTPAAAR